MAKLMVLCGLPGSGKTTWITEYIERNPEVIRISRDSIREMHSGQYAFKKNNEKLVLKSVKALIEMALFQKRTVVIDDTNLSDRRRMSWWNLATRCNATMEIVYFLVSSTTCTQRRLENKRGKCYTDWEKIINDMNIWQIPPFSRKELKTYESKVELKVIDE